MNTARHFRINSFGKEAAAVALTAFLAVTGATAQIAAGSTGIDATGNPQSELAACNSGKTQQDRATCITEVKNANAAKRAGKLDNAGGQFKANAMKRCNVHSGEDKIACDARMSGQGNTQGSVAGGGVIREIETVVGSKDVSTVQMPAQMPEQPQAQAEPQPKAAAQGQSQSGSDTLIEVPASR